MIHRSIFTATIGSESWVDSNNLTHELDLTDMKLLRMVMEVSRREIELEMIVQEAASKTR